MSESQSNQMNKATRMGRSKKSSVWGKLLRYGLPLGFSVGLCYFLFHNMDFGEMIAFVKENCDFTWILVGLIAGILGFVFRALRWRIQLRASNVDAPFHAVLYSIVGTYAVNLIFPRLGEVWRSEYLARRQKAPFVTVLGSMIADRLADTVTVLLIMIAAFFLAGDAVEGFIEKYPAAYNTMRTVVTSPWTYSVVAVAVGATWWFTRHRWRHALLVKIQTTVNNLIGGFTAVFRMKQKGLWLLLTALLWGAYFAQLYLCFNAFGFTRELVGQHGLIVVLVCFALSSFSMGIPANGGIGPYQLALMFGLGCFVADLNEQEAGAFANVVLGAQTLLTIVGGVIVFILIGVDNRRLARRSETKPASAPARH